MTTPEARLRRAVRSLSVRAQLALLVLVCVLPLAGIIGWELLNEARKAADAEASPARVAAQARAREFDARIAELESFFNAAVVAVRPTLVAGDRPAIRDLLSTLKRVLPETASEIGVNDAQGGPIASTLVSMAPAPNLGDRPWFGAALATRGMIVSEPLDSRVTGRRIVIFAFAIRDPEGRVVAVMSCSVPVARLAAVVAANDGTPARTAIEFPGSELAHAEAHSQDAPADWQVGRARSRMTPWTVTVTAPGSGAWKVLAAKSALGVAGLLLALLGMSAIHRNVARPVEALGGAFAAFGAGMGPVRVAEEGAVELRELSHAFNAMAGDLEASRQRLQACLRASSDWIWETDSKLHYTQVYISGDPGFALRLNLFIGRHMTEVVQAVDEEEFQRLRDQIASHVPFRGVRVRREAPVGEIFLDIAGEPMHDPSGAFIGYLGTARNVTELVRAELKLRHERVRYEEMIEAMHEGVVIIDAAGNYAFVNSAAEHLMQLPRAAVIGKHADAAPWRRWLEDGREATSADLVQNRVLATRERAATRMRFQRPDGRVFWLELKGAPLHDPDRRVEAVLVTLEDVTEEHESRRVLAETNLDLEARVERRTVELKRHVGELNELTYVVSHDLRAPLRAIDGYASILSAEPVLEQTAEGTDLLARIGQNARHMGRMVDALLDYSSLGRRPLARRAVSTDAALARAREDLAARIRESGLRVEADSLGVHVADAALVRMLFRALLDNAVRFASGVESPLVRVEEVALPEGRGWRVSDNGVGFDMKFAGQLFRVFQPVGERGGLGMGLATARRIVELHGGTIRGESSPGQGAAFTFTLGVGES